MLLCCGRRLVSGGSTSGAGLGVALACLVSVTYPPGPRPPGFFTNTRLSATFLVAGSPLSQRCMLRYLAGTPYYCWAHLADAVRCVWGVTGSQGSWVGEGLPGQGSSCGPAHTGKGATSTTGPWASTPRIHSPPSTGA